MTPFNDLNTLSGGSIDIVHMEGQVWVVDFWATWCSACPWPMQHNDDMMSAHPEWQGVVRILGISVDTDPESVTKFVTKKGWSEVEFYLVGNSNAKTEWGVKYLPTVAVVDKLGVIVWRGNSSDDALETLIDSLI